MARGTVTIINIRTKRKDIYVRSDSDFELNDRRRKRVNLDDSSFRCNLEKFIGQTVTTFTVSGGESGSGFTGVLLDVQKDFIKVLSRLASGPGTYGDIDLGAITDIPIDKIAAFVHNTV